MLDGQGTDKMRFNGNNIDSSSVSMQGLNLVNGVVL
jgi:hypothetical protein